MKTLNKICNVLFGVAIFVSHDILTYLTYECSPPDATM